MANPADTLEGEKPSEPSKQPWYYVKNWRLEEWRLVFTGFQAAAGLSLASLAIYGVFFTAIPETIVRQLRAERC